MTNQIALSLTEQFEQTNALLNFEGEVSTLNHKVLLTSIAHTKGEQVNVPVEKLHLMEDFNPRIQDAAFFAHIRSIADSIKLEGFYHDKPLAGIAGYKDKRPVIFITDGGCRLRAIRLAIEEGCVMDTAPVVLKDKTTTMTDLTVALVRSNEGKKFTPLELAIAAKRLFKHGMTPQVIGERIGFSTEYISQLLVIAGAPETIRKMIADGEIPAAVAIDALRTHGDDAASILKATVAVAKANGQTKITKKHMPEQIFKKALIKSAPSMMSALARVEASPAFISLPEDLKDIIRGINENISAHKVPVAEPEQLLAA